jgi:hypothetical protein
MVIIIFESNYQEFPSSFPQLSRTPVVGWFPFLLLSAVIFYLALCFHGRTLDRGTVLIASLRFFLLVYDRFKLGIQVRNLISFGEFNVKFKQLLWLLRLLCCLTRVSVILY